MATGTWSDNKNIVTLTAPGQKVTLDRPIKFVKWFLKAATAGTDEFDLQEIASGVSVAQDLADQTHVSKFVPTADGPFGPLELKTLTGGKIEIHLSDS